jgi:2-aminobenzoate-CoA ligase
VPERRDVTAARGLASAHVDSFARDRLPAPGLLPDFQFERPELKYPERLNCARVLIDEAIAEGHGPRTAIHSADGRLSYAELHERSNRIAHVLVRDLGVVPGSRVLLRGFNGPMLSAAWLATMKAGAIAVTTMPLLRARDLAPIVQKAAIGHALYDARLAEELDSTVAMTGLLGRRLSWHAGELERRMQTQASVFDTVDTSRDDVCLLAFTSGTTGVPKATVHFHRDVLAMADVVGRHLLKTAPDDIYLGSPPLGFTFGLGALLVFPLRFRAAAAVLEQPSPDALLAAIERDRASCLFTAPTMYRALARQCAGRDLSCLRKSVSAGEPLPLATRELWREATGLSLIDGIGATEMIHIFIGTDGRDAPPGSLGRPLPGYTACVLDASGQPLPPGSTGRLAIKGPTGCRYLDDERQSAYVVNGWNLTGDTFRVDADGYFWFVARADDMIVSSGYNISGPEVEAALLEHSAVRECAVVGVRDSERGQIVKAFVVLQPGQAATAALAAELQTFAKARIAPYKYPREVEFIDALPKTQTGKVQRSVLRER